MSHTNQPNTRHTITLDDSTFKKLRSKGNFGESYADLISRLIERADNIAWGHPSRHEEGNDK
jgi:predicted CopG family antitoxin